MSMCILANLALGVLNLPSGAVVLWCVTLNVIFLTLYTIFSPLIYIFVDIRPDIS